jgi:hypothetical protein
MRGGRIAGYLLLEGYSAASLPARAGNDDEIFVGNQAAMSGAPSVPVYHRLNETMAIGAGLFSDRSPDRPR